MLEFRFAFASGSGTELLLVLESRIENRLQFCEYFSFVLFCFSVQFFFFLICGFCELRFFVCLFVFYFHFFFIFIECL